MALLRAQALTKRFGGMVVVNDVSLSLAEGEVLGVIGPNGAGKTTTFNLLSGLLSPDAGRVFLSEQDVTGLRPHRRCRLGLGRTFQIVQPFPDMTVLENVMLGTLFGSAVRLRPDQTRRKAEELCDFVGLAGKAGHSPGSLTVAELKRMEMARSLGTSPRVLLLDEPMQGLTMVEAREAVGMVKAVRDRFGASVLIIEHVMHTVRDLCDRVIVMHHGNILAEGRYDAVATDPEVIEAYLGKSETETEVTSA